MKPQQFEIKYIERILELYNECLGPADIKLITPENILKDIRNESFFDGYRIGSRFDEHSKLKFILSSENDVIPEFNPNFSPKNKNTREHEEAVKAGEEFTKRCLEYLVQFE